MAKSKFKKPSGKQHTSHRFRKFLAYCFAAALLVTGSNFASFINAFNSLSDSETFSASADDTQKYSGCLSYKMYSNYDASTRMYIEYSVPYTNGEKYTYFIYDDKKYQIIRQTVFYVYAYAGETICLGSSISDSTIDADDNIKSTVTDMDIVVKCPDGTVNTFDNDENTKKGYIETVAQEKAGANYNGLNTSGYIPHELTVRDTGIYEVRFHSRTGKNNNTNPNNSFLKTSSGWGNNESARKTNQPAQLIAAFDITVVGTDGNGQQVEKTGRTYARYISFNSGANNSKSYDTYFSYGDFYCVTEDGYIYKSDFTFAPWGATFFSDNRGIMDSDGKSVYYSILGSTSNNGSLLTPGDNYSIHDPNSSDSSLVTTHKVFIEYPDESLVGVLYNIAYAPDEIKEVEFIGSKEGNVAYEQTGGYFKFNILHGTTATLTINFDKYNEKHQQKDENGSLVYDADGNPVYEQKKDESGNPVYDDDGNPVYFTPLKEKVITQSVIQGENSIRWDGKDGNNQIVPMGWYNDANIECRVEVSVGEIHFPLLDVERIKDITIERVNKIYSFDENGELIDESDKYSDSIYTIYYDNKHAKSSANNSSVSVMDGQCHSDNCTCGNCTDSESTDSESTSSTCSSYSCTCGNNCTCIDYAECTCDSEEAGIDSSGCHTMQALYNANASGSNYYTPGDVSIVDIWTYVKTEKYAEVPVDMLIIPIDGYYAAELDGTVFFDADKDSSYEITGGDYGLPDIPLELSYYYCETRWDEKRDESGNLIGLTSPFISEDGENTACAYYHDYEIVYDESGQPKLYRYSNYLHEGNPEDLGYVTVSSRINHEGEAYQYTDYLVWIPVAQTAVSDSDGKYYFTGILVNQDETIDDEYDDMTIRVTDRSGAYELTTGSTQSGDYIGLSINSETNSHEQPYGLDGYGTSPQELSLKALKENLDTIEDSTATPIYYAADIGYHYDVSDPLTIIKIWGKDSAQLQSVTVLVQGLDAFGNVIYERDNVNLDWTNGYRNTLSDLPANVGDTAITSYQVYSETFVAANGKTYKYDVNGSYYELDDNGEYQIIGSDFPYSSTISAADTSNSITIQNMSSNSYSLTLKKVSAFDGVTQLENAVFKLYILDPATEQFETVVTNDGEYRQTTDENGTAVFRGLMPGTTYKLSEVLPPDRHTNVDDIIFTIDNNGDVDTNSGWTFEKQSGGTYTVTVTDAMEENVTPDLIKYDQYGNLVKGAKFQLYSANEDYSIKYKDDGITPFYVSDYIETDENGRVSITNENGRELYLSELRDLLQSDYMVLEEVSPPDGYRATITTSAHLCIIGEGMSSYIDCVNPYESGVWVSPNATVYAPDVLYVADENEMNIAKGFGNNYIAPENDYEYGSIKYKTMVNNTINGTGTLFAVVLKRNGAEEDVTSLDDFTFKDWIPVYGSDNDGYASAESIYAIAQAGNAYYFDANSTGSEMLTTITNFPGEIQEYYTFMKDNEMDVDSDSPEYLVAYYYSSATNYNDITQKNTVRVTSHGNVGGAEEFSILWSTSVTVSDIVNALFVQKTNDSNNLIDNTVFALYDAASESDGTGYFIASDTSGGNVYVKLLDGSKAEIYQGIIDEATGILTVDSSPSQGSYTIDTTGCDGIDKLEEKTGYLSNTGTITVTSGSSTYIIYPAENAEGQSCVAYTHDECKYVSESGTGHFYYLNNGKYFLKEIYAPFSYKLNYENVEVIVDESGVYANAGNSENGVAVGNGVGYLVSNLNVFASIDSINRTLSYITANQLTCEKDGFLSAGDEWTEPQNYLNLVYNGNANSIKHENMPIFDYILSDGSNDDMRIWTDEGWSNLSISQDQSKYESTAKYVYTPLDENITNLFSNSTFVKFTDEYNIFMISKDIYDDDMEAPVTYDTSQRFLFKIECYESREAWESGSASPLFVYYTNFSCDETGHGSVYVNALESGWHVVTELTDWSNTDYDFNESYLSSMNEELTINEDDYVAGEGFVAFDMSYYRNTDNILIAGFKDKESKYAYRSAQAYAENKFGE